MTAPLNHEQKRLLKVNAALQTLNQEGWGHLYSSSQHVVSHKDPAIRKQIQDSLDHAAGGALILFLFSIVESEWPKSEKVGPKKWQQNWKRRMDAADYERMLAFRHIRHSVAHGYNGVRVARNKDEVAAFDTVMASSHPLQGVTQPTKQILHLTQGAGVDCWQHAKTAVKRALGLALGQPQP